MCTDADLSFYTAAAAAAALLLHPPSWTLLCICDTQQTESFLIYIRMGGKID